MEKLQFTTNINCGGCVAKVTPFLAEEKRIKTWSVNTEAPEKVLTVESEGMKAEEIKALVVRAGFRIEEAG
ncbi:MAG TPA: heavy-metal-associated domain-containing protein [Puia sp.]|jgi:copper chaperone